MPNMLVVKSIELAEADLGELSELNSYKLILTLIGKLNQVWDKNGRVWSIDSPQVAIALHAKEFANIFKVDQDNAYAILKDVATKLVRSDIAIKPRTGEECNYSLRIMNVCSSATYHDNTGTIIVQFTNEIMEHLDKLKNRFVSYQLSSMAGFGSYYSLRLFEWLTSSQSVGKVAVTVEEFRKIMGCSDDGYDLFGNINSAVIKPAIAEIKKQKNVTINCEKIKDGRKVSGLIFTFQKDFNKKPNKAKVYENFKIENKLKGVK